MQMQAPGWHSVWLNIPDIKQDKLLFRQVCVLLKHYKVS